MAAKPATQLLSSISEAALPCLLVSMVTDSSFCLVVNSFEQTKFIHDCFPPAEPETSPALYLPSTQMLSMCTNVKA